MFVRQMGFPTVVTLHELVELTDLRALNAPGGPLAKVGAKALTKISSQADLICLTRKEYAEWLSMRGVDCTHIPIGVYHEPQLLDTSDSQGLLFFSTLAPFKGLELLFSAFETLHREYPQLTLTIAGAEHVRFPEYARQLKIRFGKMERVNWLGQTSEDNVMELFRRAQIVVLPYNASTGSSSVLYQAATWGRSVVASDLVDIKKLVTESGLKVEFFKNGDASSLSAAIRSLIDSKEKIEDQAAHNFKAVQRTRPHETCRQYIRAFNRALEKRLSPERIAIPAAKEEKIV
jgi:glycosyltransferase involved in cell wall biosynthesis